ncbi:MAG: hypothetical protein ACK5KT_01785 [Dysgonomonas sp.]
MTMILRGLLFIILISGSQSNIMAQVTIGANETPASGSLLQLKNITNVPNGKANSTKGLLLPRVLLSKKKELYPMFLNDAEDPTSGANSEYTINKSTLDLEHTGLTVFNTKENIDEVLCFGVNFWDGSQWDCLNSNANYSIDCSSVKVVGLYKENQQLNPSQHYIIIDVIAEDKADGAIYHITTNTVDGIFFEGKGKLVAGTQTVILEGKGTPTSTAVKNMIISSNSIKSNTTCSAQVVVLIPRKRILGIGGGTYGWTPTAINTGSYKVTKEATNFGSLINSTVLVEGLDLIHLNLQGGPSTDASAQSAIREYLLGTNPVSICILAQDVYINVAMAAIYAEYLNKGGVLIVFNEGNGGGFGSDATCRENGTITNLLQAIWGKTTGNFGHSKIINADLACDNVLVGATLYGGYPGAVYPLTDINDDILNGPFGDVRGKQWGEDASWARGVTNIPEEDIIVYSRGKSLVSQKPDNLEYNKTMISAFRHKYKNFIYFGDGGFTSSTIINDLPTVNPGVPLLEHRTINPFAWKNEGGKKFIPTPKYNYGNSKPLYSPKTYEVYNSVIYCNIMAWAIRQAELNRTNTK